MQVSSSPVAQENRRLILKVEPKILVPNFAMISKFYPQRNSGLTRKEAIKKCLKHCVHSAHTKFNAHTRKYLINYCLLQNLCIK